MIRSFRDAGILAIVGVVLGFSLHAIHPGGLDLSRVAELRAGRDPRYLTLSDAMERMTRGRSAVLDVRRHDQYIRGHIPGAVSLPARAFDSEFERVSRFLAKDQEIILYCDGPYCVLADSVLGHLQRLGYTNVHVFEGGWLEWSKAGLQSEAGE